MADRKDEEIDTSDIPEIAEDQWSKSELFRPKKAFTSFRWDAEVLEVPLCSFLRSRLFSALAGCHLIGCGIPWNRALNGPL